MVQGPDGKPVEMTVDELQRRRHGNRLDARGQR
jgi:hypothetical protein